MTDTRLHPCEHDSCPEWVELGADAHEPDDDPEVVYCARHCPKCEDTDG